MGKKNSGQKKDENYVPVVMARDRDEAEEYRQLLSDHDIVARLSDENEDGMDEEHLQARELGMGHGVAVLVPDVFLDEASEVIADHEDVEDFIDTSDNFVASRGDEKEFGYPDQEDRPEEAEEDDLEEVEVDDDLFDDDDDDDDEDDLFFDDDDEEELEDDEEF